MMRQDDPGQKRPHSPFAPLRNPAFAIYWFSGLFSYFGWMIQIVAVSWLMVTLGGTPELVALVQTSVSLPLLLFSLLAGALADIFGRRTIVLWSQAILILVSVLMCVCAYLGILTPWALLAFSFLIGCCRALNIPGWQTFISEIVPRRALSSAVALNIVGFNIGRSLGPAIGGIIVGVFGVFVAFTFNVVANFGVFLSALAWPRSARSADLPPETIGAAMAAGIRYVSLSQVQTRVLARAVAFSLGASSMMSLMPLVASELIGGGASTYGFLFGAFGAGAVVAAFFGDRFRSAFSREIQAHLGFLLFAASLALTAATSLLALSMLFVALGGGAWLLVQSGLSADVQMSSPRWAVSRCQAILHSVLFGAMALGSWLWGELAGQIGIAGSLYASAVAVVASMAIGLFLPLRDFDVLGLEPKAPMSAKNGDLDVLPISGPILVTVEYRIRKEDIPDFLKIMSARRRQRGRDGARGWVLSVDVQDPTLWSERFRLPTWTEVARHKSRRTVFGANLDDQLVGMHQGDLPPVERHELVRHPGAVSDLPFMASSHPSAH